MASYFRFHGSGQHFAYSFYVTIVCTSYHIILSFYAATKYGRGVYFAWDASYSAHDVFSPKDGKGYKYMFLAKVLTGDFTVGDPSYIQPPPKNPNGLDLFDSVVDSITRPLIFVIFADAQAYPNYLITFT